MMYSTYCQFYLPVIDIYGPHRGVPLYIDIYESTPCFVMLRYYAILCDVEIIAYAII
jgi:hypothetical protein